MSPLDYQFDSPDADIVLQTIDHNEFCVHSCILAAASPFFRDMFTLPQGDIEKRSIAEIHVSEPSDVLDTLLRLVYPIPDPFIGSLEELALVIEAAIKYDFVTVNSLPSKTSHFFTTLFANTSHPRICIGLSLWTRRRDENRFTIHAEHKHCLMHLP
jgi:hypothetical protein